MQPTRRWFLFGGKLIENTVTHNTKVGFWVELRVNITVGIGIEMIRSRLCTTTMPQPFQVLKFSWNCDTFGIQRIYVNVMTNSASLSLQVTSFWQSTIRYRKLQFSIGLQFDTITITWNCNYSPQGKGRNAWESHARISMFPNQMSFAKSK